MPLKIVSPTAGAAFQVTGDPTWPSIKFKTDGTGQHTWKWKIAWLTFSQSGTATTGANEWDAQAAVTNYGGTLTVEASSAAGSAVVSVKIKGTNPQAASVTTYVQLNHADGFDKILSHESKMKHFNRRGSPSSRSITDTG